MKKLTDELVGRLADWLVCCVGDCVIGRLIESQSICRLDLTADDRHVTKTQDKAGNQEPCGSPKTIFFLLGYFRWLSPSAGNVFVFLIGY